jgi:hypothetical protein
MANTYYVSNSGNDTNTGQLGSPWQTLIRVNSATFQAGDQILFERGGTFYGSLTIKQSGNSANPITLDAYGSGANPVITGFTNVTAWTSLGGNLWESTSTVSTLGNCNMVSINSVNTEMGRFPKSTAANGGYLTYQSHSVATSITSSDLTGTPNWTGAELVIRNQAYHLNRATVISQTAGTLNFNSIGDSITNGNGFFFQNDDRCLTQQNDWRFNSSTQKLIMYSTTTPVNVKVASVENLITIDGNYIAISNIDFIGANACAIWKQPNTGYKTGISVTNCNFSFMGIAAVYAYINHLVIENNTISICNNSAIVTSASTDVSIRNNTISEIGKLKGMKNLHSPYGSNCAIEIGNAKRIIVEYNSLRNIGFNGISFYASDTVLIKNNFIDTYCTILDDGGAIYTYSAPNIACHAVKITGNICINGIGAFEGSSFTHIAAGIYLDARSANIELTYNTVANAQDFGMFIASNGNVRSRYNTVYNSSEIQFYSVWFGGNIPSPTTSDTVKNNLFISKQKYSSSDDSYQKCLAFYFTGSDPTLQIKASTALDSNCYARPTGEDKVLRASIPGPNSNMTLAEWRSFYGQDVHSFGSPQSISDTSKFRFEYNNTKVARTIPLSKPMIDFRGNKYVNSVTLQPYTSLVMMEDNNPVEILTFTLPGQLGNSVINAVSDTIWITMPSTASLTNLAATFTLSPGASAKVNSLTQVSGTTTNNFTNPVVYSIIAQNGTTAKNWTVKVTTSGTYQLIARHSGKAIGIRGGSIDDLAIVEQETYTGAQSQQFVITDQGGGYFKICPVSITSKGLDVFGQSTTDGASVIQYTYFSGTNQQWKFDSMGGGYYHIVNRNSNKCLDVVNASTVDGTAIQQYTCGNGTNQQFTLTKLKSTPAVMPTQDGASTASETNNNPTLAFFPNPSANGNFFVNLNSLSADKNIEINIYDINGSHLYKQKVKGNKIVEIKSELKAGMYIVKLTYEQNIVTKELVVK